MHVTTSLARMHGRALGLTLTGEVFLHQILVRVELRAPFPTPASLTLVAHASMARPPAISGHAQAEPNKTCRTHSPGTSCDPRNTRLPRLLPW